MLSHKGFIWRKKVVQTQLQAFLIFFSFTPFATAAVSTPGCTTRRKQSCLRLRCLTSPWEKIYILRGKTTTGLQSDLWRIIWALEGFHLFSRAHLDSRVCFFFFYSAKENQSRWFLSLVWTERVRESRRLLVEAIKQSFYNALLQQHPSWWCCLSWSKHKGCVVLQFFD